MKRILVTAGLAAALAAAWPSAAQQGPPPGRRAADRPQPMRPQPPPPQQQQQQREFPGREAQDPRRAGMTPDERRQLRRDITDHGHDVYRDRQPPQR
jgi:hypothetical protein